ncbi:MAG: peptidase [Bacilli bacterium]|nr:peptidase [Bacilli bacterium]
MKLIGLSGGISTINEELQGTTVSLDYTNGVLRAGGLPVIIPAGFTSEQVCALCDQLQGLILTGGDDVDPGLFGEDPQPGLGQVNPQRDQLELALVRGMMERTKPVLGICRGIQVLNVALGGSLYQDIPRQVRGAILHRQKGPRGYQSHRISILAGSKLASIAGDQECKVNSFHHQGIKDLAPGLEVTAVAPDGIIEAVELANYPFLVGVQWHPENLWQNDSAAFQLFQQFVDSIVVP